MTFEFISVKEAAQKMKVTERWIQQLCKDGKIEGATRFAGTGPWLIPLSWIDKNPLQR
ncbi:MAG: DNA-binding protein [Acutalibacteraceae bacterium]|nr:DNA-binding protein [Acutalibacteraceae bacterium]